MIYSIQLRAVNGSLIRTSCHESRLSDVLEAAVTNESKILEVKPIVEKEQFYAKVLDHGYVKLIDHMGDDLRPLRSARMSTNNETGVDEKKDASLRSYLWGNKHVSPFATCIATYELFVPIGVMRQMDRHRTVHISNMEMTIEDYDNFRQFTDRNEFSARYAEMPDTFYVPDLQRFKAKGTINKQGSGALLPESHRIEARAIMRENVASCRKDYERLLELGVASEVARFVLPFSQYTRIQLQASMLNWFNFLALRLDPHAQEETRLFAIEIANSIRQLWPQCWDVFQNHTLNGIGLSWAEKQYLIAVFDKSKRHTYGPDAEKSLKKKLGIAA